MKKFSVSTPEGMRDKLFSECTIRKGIVDNLTELFSSLGYSEIITPTVEYLDVFLDSESPLEQESMLKVIDRSGRILVMRPDMTTPISRVAAAKLTGIPAPYRFYYTQNVFRSDMFNTGRNSEISQSGVELIGASGMAADVEMIALAIEALKECGLKDYRLEIGHTGFYRALAVSLNMDNDTLEEMRSLIETKNFAALNDLLRAYNGSPASAAIKKLPQLFGGVEVFDEALSLTENEEAVSVITYLKQIYKELDAAGLSDRVMIDLGLVNQLHYYTGVVFRGYAKGAGSNVLSGGRYDRLAASFGRGLPATGFAIDLDAVANCAEKGTGSKLVNIVYYEKGYLRDALDFIKKQPKGSSCFAACDNEEDAKAVAKEKQAEYMVNIGPNGIKRMEADTL